MDQETQERIAYLERELADMSGEVARLATEVALLTRRVALLMEREAEREVTDNGGTVPLARSKAAALVERVFKPIPCNGIVSP